MTIPVLIIYSILFFALFGNSFIALGIPEYFAIGTEFLIILLFLVAMIPKTGRNHFILHLLYTFLLMLSVSVCSIALNKSSVSSAIFSLRLLWRFYFFYLALINLELHPELTKKINSFVFILLILQLPVVAIKFSMYGLSERTIGAYAATGGSLTTILPITLIFFLASFYFFYKKSFSLLLVAIGFIAFSIVGRKRAIAFLYPIQFWCIYYFIYIKGTGAKIRNKLGTLALICFLAISLTSAVFYFNDTLNPEKEVGGSVDFGYAFSYAKEYVDDEKYGGYTTGRLSTTKRIFSKMLEEDLFTFMCGLGPGCVTLSMFTSRTKRIMIMDKLKIAYGETAMNKIMIEYGFLGVLTYTVLVISFATMCLRYYKLETDRYWKAFASGAVGLTFSMFFFFLCYGAPAFWGDTMPALYFYVTAVIFTRLQQIRATQIESRI